MWLGKNRDGSVSISEHKLVRGCIFGTCPNRNDGSFITDFWVNEDQSTPDMIHINVLPNLGWTDEAIEVDIVPKEALTAFYKIIDKYKNKNE